MKPRLYLPLAILFAFLGCIVSAWAWFHVGTQSDAAGLRMDVRTVIPGHRFDAEPLSESARAKLQTTHYLNGAFVADQDDRITVFSAEWSAREGKSLDVVSHTPDVCWVGIGWVPVSLGQPQKVKVPLDGGDFVFECRVFETPGKKFRELVLWATILNGEIVDEGERWASEDRQTNEPDRQLRFVSGRRRAGELFLHALASRQAGSGSKQFIRFSTECSEDWEPALRRLEDFARLWISVQPL